MEAPTSIFIGFKSLWIIPQLCRYCIPFWWFFIHFSFKFNSWAAKRGERKREGRNAHGNREKVGKGKRRKGRKGNKEEEEEGERKKKGEEGRRGRKRRGKGGREETVKNWVTLEIWMATFSFSERESLDLVQKSRRFPSAGGKAEGKKLVFTEAREARSGRVGKGRTFERHSNERIFYMLVSTVASHNIRMIENTHYCTLEPKFFCCC